MKKFGFAILGLMALLILGIALVPVFYSVDDLRPEIKKQIELRVRGKVDLGELSLKTFPSITLTVGKSKITAPAPFDKAEFINFEEAQVSIPLYALLFSPHVNLTLLSPAISIVNKGEGSNLAAFLPLESSEQSKTSESPLEDAESNTEGDPLAALPGFLKARVLKATVSVNLESAKISLVEMGATKGAGTSLSNLDLHLENIGLNSPMGLRFGTNLSYKEGDTVVEGPIVANGEIKVASDGKVYDVQYEVQNDMSKLDIAFGGLFKKKSGVAFSVDLKGKAQKAEFLDAQILELKFKFGDLNVLSSLIISKIGEPSSEIVFKLDGKGLKLAGLSEFLPMAKSYGLAGDVGFEGSAVGSVERPKLDFKVNLMNVTGRTPELVLPIEKLNGVIGVSGDPSNPVINIDPFNLKIGTSDLSVKLRAQGVDRPDVSLAVTANRFNVDELLGTQSNAEAMKSGGTGGGGADQEPSAQASTEPLDESLNKMAPELDKALANPMLDKVQADVKILAKSMRLVGGEFRNARMNIAYKSRVLSVNDTGIDGYKGSFLMNGRFNLVPKLTGFDLKSSLKGVSIGDAVKVHMPTWKDEISGTMNGNFQISGKGLTKQQIAQNLRGGLNGNVVNGRTSIPVIKLISGILEKLPKKVQNPAEKKTKNQVFNGEFKTMKLDSQINGRVINLSDLDVIFAAKDAGLGDLRFQGKGTANFDRKVDFTGTAYIEPTVLPVPELKGPSGKVEIPMKFSGDMSDPKADIGYSVKILGPRMAKAFIKSDAGKKLQNKVKDEVKKLKLPDSLKNKFKF
ncbi:hypothetical protein GW915_03720 [bacterium]|nr:hypothetical protein [bacterium]